MINSHLNVCQTYQEIVIVSSFFLWFSADSDGYHIPSLCHTRNFIYMHWKIKTIFRVSVLSYIITKCSNQLKRQPLCQGSQNCSSPSSPLQQPPQNRDSGLRILKRIWRSFLLPSQQQQSRGIFNLAHDHQTHPRMPCMSIELGN